jgi:hypothetical protein
VRALIAHPHDGDAPARVAVEEDHRADFAARATSFRTPRGLLDLVAVRRYPEVERWLLSDGHGGTLSFEVWSLFDRW